MLFHTLQRIALKMLYDFNKITQFINPKIHPLLKSLPSAIYLTHPKKTRHFRNHNYITH